MTSSSSSSHNWPGASPFPVPNPEGFRATAVQYRDSVKDVWNKGQETTSDAAMRFIAWAFGSISPSVLDEVWPHVIFFTTIGTAVTCINEFTSASLGVNYYPFTMVATVVAFVTSFHVNNCYNHWWEGRVIWSNITSNCRSLASLIWLHVPNEPSVPRSAHPKARTSRSRQYTTRPVRKSSTARKCRDMKSIVSSPGDETDSTWWSEKWKDTQGRRREHDGSESPKTPAAVALPSTESYFDINPRAEERGSVKFAEEPETMYESGSDEEPLRGDEEDETLSEHVEHEQDEVDPAIAGIVEKKTFIGLIQAYAIALKHSLRGERGPFYTDLYPLISFLPKYNPSIGQPISRDSLFLMWQNGLPQEKWHRPNDFAAIPLTQVATYNGYTVDIDTGLPVSSPSSDPKTKDKEAGHTGLTTNTSEFTDQAFEAASWYVPEGRDTITFTKPIHHRLGHDIRFVHPEPKGRMHRGERIGSYGQRVNMTTAELMPPRHPPPPKIWDYLRPLRIFKVIADKIKSRESLDKQLRVKGGKRNRRQVGVKAEIAHELLLYLGSYAADLDKRGLSNAFLSNTFLVHIHELQKAIADLEKIVNTPIPSAYRSHLRLVIWAYLTFLPFQLYPLVGWVTIPAIACIAIVYLGYMEVGAQLERPFGYERSDLDLDWFCLNICTQIAEITAFPTSVPCSEIIRHHCNQPFTPALSRSAVEIIGSPEAHPTPNSKGFAASYRDAVAPHSTVESHTGGIGKSQRKTKAPCTMRDLELAANQNARESEIVASLQRARPWTDLERKTNQEVAVLAI